MKQMGEKREDGWIGLEIAILEDLAKFHRTTLSQDKFKSERGSMYQLSVKLLTGGLE